MPDRYPPSALAAAESAIREAFPGEFGKPGMPEPDALARAALDAAAPVLAEAWGLDPEPPSAAALRAYLRSRNWAERPPGEAGSLFDLPGTSVTVAVLLHDGGDADRRFLADTLKRVAEAEGRTTWQVARDIGEVRAGPGDGVHLDRAEVTRLPEGARERLGDDLHRDSRAALEDRLRRAGRDVREDEGP